MVQGLFGKQSKAALVLASGYQQNLGYQMKPGDIKHKDVNHD